MLSQCSVFFICTCHALRPILLNADYSSSCPTCPAVAEAFLGRSSSLRCVQPNMLKPHYSLLDIHIQTKLTGVVSPHDLRISVAGWIRVASYPRTWCLPCLAAFGRLGSSITVQVSKRFKFCTSTSFDDPRLNLVHEDAAEFVKKEVRLRPTCLGSPFDVPWARSFFRA